MEIILSTFHDQFLGFVIPTGILILDHVRKGKPYDLKALKDLLLYTIIFWAIAISISYVRAAL